MVLPLMYDDLVEPVAAGEVVAFKAVLHENPAGKIAAQPAVAIHIDWFTAFQLRQPFAQFIQREVDRPPRYALFRTPPGCAYRAG